MNGISVRIILTGLIAGTLDIIAAMANFFIATGKNPVRVLQFIASGVFGTDAFSDDPLMPIYGLIFHFCIATIWTALFFIAYPIAKVAAKHWILSGVVYALIVWGTMTRVVLPLSYVPQQPFEIDKALLAIAILIACIGLPISYSANRFYSRQHLDETVQ